MFSTKQTRLILFLSIIILVLISVIGLNWNNKEEDVYEAKAVLDKPDYIKEKKKKSPPVKKRGPVKEETGGLEDEGSKIILY
ncbi:MAG: hypothetical protein PF545_05955 [Elusimicrobia bacterium]|jgi:hypothetical protein|nr:hypothetical protein [Elusimicrobiota bacterium]